MVAIQHLVCLLVLSQAAVLVCSQTCRSTFCGQCLDCEGNFRDLEDVIPIFPRPTVNDGPINNPNNSLQFMESDVLGCNEIQSQIFYYDDNCSLLDVPGDNIIYATQSNIQGRNLFNQNSLNWDTIEGHVINITVQCQNQLRFCVLFGLGDGDVVPTSDGRNSGVSDSRGAIIGTSVTVLTATALGIAALREFL